MHTEHKWQTWHYFQGKYRSPILDMVPDQWSFCNNCSDDFS